MVAYLTLNLKTGDVEEVTFVADDLERQIEGMERLRYMMKEIQQFSQHTTTRARLYRVFKGGRLGRESS